MYLENDTKFYEISWIKGAIYIHFGKIPDMDARLPFGTVKKYSFEDKNKRKSFYNNKINEKLKKGYEVIKDGVGASSDMKEMIKLKKL
tara:strand:- start:111 stop:374 length:264 start_codon:yes stop_codon:yes gene_type:complete